MMGEKNLKSLNFLILNNKVHFISTNSLNCFQSLKIFKYVKDAHDITEIFKKLIIINPYEWFEIKENKTFIRL